MRHQIVAYLSKNNCFGELGIFNDSPWAASIVTTK